MKTKLLTSLISSLIIMAFPIEAFAASLSLSPVSGTFNKGCKFSLQINLNTTGVQTDGTDAILRYDQSRLTADTISAGTIYSDYPGSSIDDSTGKVTVSGLASVSSPFQGSGTLATVNFSVKDAAQVGATQVKFDFDPNDKAKTTDSNVVERGTVADVLSSVVDGSYIVGTGSCAAASPSPTGIVPRGTVDSTPSATTPYYPQPKPTLPPGGTQEFTFTLGIVGAVLTILGILGLALL